MPEKLCEICVNLKGRNYAEVKWHKKIFLSIAILLENKGLGFFFSCAYMCVSYVYNTQTRNMYVFICVSICLEKHIIAFWRKCSYVLWIEMLSVSGSKLVKNTAWIIILIHSNTFSPYRPALPGEDLLEQWAAFVICTKANTSFLEWA